MTETNYTTRSMRRRRGTGKWEVTLSHTNPLTGETVRTYHTIEAKTERQTERRRDALILDLERKGEGMPYFKADLCCYSPESYSLEEKREICDEMFSTSKTVLDAMRADFEQLPAEARSRLSDMFCQSGVESPEWWDVLVGEGEPLYRGLEVV